MPVTNDFDNLNNIKSNALLPDLCLVGPWSMEFVSGFSSSECLLGFSPCKE